MSQFDSIIIVSFGGPNEPSEVMPFLRNVVRGRNIPDERLVEVAEHYMHFGGKSPINEQNLALIEALKQELHVRNINFPIYFGNRNWNPYIKDSLKQMHRDGKKNALAFFTSMFSSYSGCRQYRENIENARNEFKTETGIEAPQVQKVRMGFNHPGFIESMKSRVLDSLSALSENERKNPRLIFTAHSIPIGMAKNSSYELQLQESCKLVAVAANIQEYILCYQSRSGSPMQPWLEPDISEVIKSTDKNIYSSVIVAPIGFISDHMEVLFDLDEEAKETAESAGIVFARAGTVGTHPAYVNMIADLIEERLFPEKVEKKSIGDLPSWHDVCPVDCCLYEVPKRQ